MRPLVVRGNVWRVVRVSPDDPFLIDRTGVPKLATTDIGTKTIRISKAVMPPLFDRVYLHEVTHAIMEEYGVTDILSQVTDGRQQVFVEELMAWLVETHAIEAIDAVSRSLGRPVCTDGICMGGYDGTNHTVA